MKIQKKVDLTEAEAKLLAEALALAKTAVTWPADWDPEEGWPEAAEAVAEQLKAQRGAK